MRKNVKRCTAAVLAAILAVSASIASASAESKCKIVVIGDSISADGEGSYVDLITKQTGAEVINFAKDDCTTGSLLADLDSQAFQTELSDADVILVTVGMHDAMDPFMAKTHEWMDTFGFESFRDVFTAQLSDYGLTEDALNDYFDEIKIALRDEVDYEASAANMLSIGEKLSAYTDAQVIYQTNYNCINTIEDIGSLSDKRQYAYNSICRNVTYYLNKGANASMSTIASAYGGTVIDVFTGFDGLAYKYVNLDKLDLNPNAAGHQWIAEQILNVMVIPDDPTEEPTGDRPMGDVDGNNTVDALDASLILIHAAASGSSGTGTLDEAALKAADFNRDGTVDALDASSILVYAAQSAIS